MTNEKTTGKADFFNGQIMELSSRWRDRNKIEKNCTKTKASTQQIMQRQKKFTESHRKQFQSNQIEKARP